MWFLSTPLPGVLLKAKMALNIVCKHWDLESSSSPELKHWCPRSLTFTILRRFIFIFFFFYEYPGKCTTPYFNVSRVIKSNFVPVIMIKKYRMLMCASDKNPLNVSGPYQIKSKYPVSHVEYMTLDPWYLMKTTTWLLHVKEQVISWQLTLSLLISSHAITYISYI